MKTLHLTNCWHAASGGIGTFYRALLEAANREGHYMRLVVPGESTSVAEVGEFGRIYNIEAPRAPLDRGYRMVLPHRYLLPHTALQRIINDEKPDLIEISDKYSMPYLAGLLRTRRLPGVRLRPTVIGLSHERMDENVAAYLTPGQAGRRFSRWFMKWLYFGMFDHHVTISEHVAEELIRASRGHRVRRGIWVAPMGVDCDMFTPARRSPQGRRRLLDLVEAGEETTVLFYAGRLAPEKNPGLLLDTAARLDPEHYRLAIAGTGTLLGILKKECAARGLRHVKFPGHIPDRETLADYYANADIFVHPNPREPFGIAPLEAMASGLPLVAPNRGGVTSYADGSNAWLADDDPVSFAKAVASVVSQGPERTRRILAARQTAEQHRWPLVTARYLEIYRELHALVSSAHDGAAALCASRTGKPAAVPARIWSTPGDLLGRELVKLQNNFL